MGKEVAVFFATSTKIYVGVVIANSSSCYSGLAFEFQSLVSETLTL